MCLHTVNADQRQCGKGEAVVTARWCCFFCCGGMGAVATACWGWAVAVGTAGDGAVAVGTAGMGLQRWAPLGMGAL